MFENLAVTLITSLTTILWAFLQNCSFPMIISWSHASLIKIMLWCVFYCLHYMQCVFYWTMIFLCHTIYLSCYINIEPKLTSKIIWVLLCFHNCIYHWEQFLNVIETACFHHWKNGLAQWVTKATSNSAICYRFRCWNRSTQ